MKHPLKRNLVLLSLLILAFLAACTNPTNPEPEPEPNPINVKLELIEGNNEGRLFDSPVGITHAGDGSNRLFVIEKVGSIAIVENDQRINTFLDIKDKVLSQGEQGFLGLAFHPNYKDNGIFFVSYTDKDGTSTLARYSVSDDPYIANADSGEILLTVNQPGNDHNGGHIIFGPDRLLYYGLGDGGANPEQSSDLSSLLGSILRLNVTNTGPYTVPANNPFIDQANARAEIFAYGLRNPWRFSFDRDTDELYIGDVGDVSFEEVNVIPAGSAGGQHFGWNLMEGLECHSASPNCDQTNLTLPILDYGRDQGASITGGFVYRGAAIPELQGKYIYGDFISGRVWVAEQSNGVWTSELLLETDLGLSSFGEDEAGELYLLDIATGSAHRLISTEEGN